MLLGHSCGRNVFNVPGRPPTPWPPEPGSDVEVKTPPKTRASLPRRGKPKNLDEKQFTIVFTQTKREALDQQAEAEKAKESGESSDLDEDEPRQALDEDDPMRQPLDDALWNGFAFDAAIGESDIWYVLDPSSTRC